MSILPPHPPEFQSQRKRRSRHESFGAPTRALLALDAGRMGSWTLNIATSEVTADRFLSNLIGLDFDTQPWDLHTFFRVVHPDDSKRVQAAVENAWTGASPNYDVEFRRRPIDHADPVQWLSARGQVTERAEDGTPLFMVGVNWDVTEQRLHSEKLELLVGQLRQQHEGMVAHIQHIIGLGAQTSVDKQSLIDTLQAQVDAMTVAQTITRQSSSTHQI